MKGLLMLTEARSGSNWLGNAASHTGVLGNSGEWISPIHYSVNPKHVTAEEFIQKIFERASTDNGVFYIKIFPRHLHWFQSQFGFDLINHLAVDHDLLLVTLTRRDRLRQAISFSKGIQSKKWFDKITRNNKNKGKARYDFAHICRAYFMIGRSYNYWKTYLAVQEREYTDFVYEDLMADPAPFLQALAAHVGINDIPPFQSDCKIQRNTETEDWYAKFKKDIQSRNFLGYTATSTRSYSRTLGNLGKFLSGQHMKSIPFDYWPPVAG